GLAFRGKADGIPLLVAMATGDPITLIRQQARFALADIQDAYRLAGRPVPEVTLPEPKPLEGVYPPRGLEWADTRSLDLPPKVPALPKDGPALVKYLEKRLSSSNFRNLNNAQASGAERMMIAEVEETRLAFAALARQPGEPARKALLA